MNLNDGLQWLALAATLIFGAMGLWLQHAALRLSKEEVHIAREQLRLEKRRSKITSDAEARRLALEEAKLAERKAGREQRAAGAIMRFLLGDS